MSRFGKELLSCNYRYFVIGPTTMLYKIFFATLAVLIGNEFAFGQQIPSTTTAAEMWNPWTWFWPYAIASAEAYRDYYAKAQKATNELYQQIYKTNAFPWVTGNWGLPQVNPSKGNGDSGQNNSSGGSGGSGTGSQNNPSGGSGGQNNPSGDSGGQNNPSGGSGGQNNPSGGSGGQNNPSGGSGGQNNPSGGSGEQSNPSGGSGSSDQNNLTGGSGGNGSGQSNSTGDSGSNGSEGTVDANVAGSV